MRGKYAAGAHNMQKENIPPKNILNKGHKKYRDHVGFKCMRSFVFLDLRQRETE